MATRLERAEPPLVVIVGPTASGKTALAIELAEQYDGEIICADSRTVYKDMDIGTAKPTAEERQRIRHWGLDLVSPGERFTAADFQQYAVWAIADIRGRGKMPLLVGGTGLYVDGVVFAYQFGGGYDVRKRAQLETRSTGELQQYCIDNNIELPKNKTNRRHLIRAIEQKSINTKRQSEPIDNSIIVGIATETSMLRTRIEDRAEQLLTSGVVEEAIMLGKKYGWESEAMTANIYPLLRQYIDGEASLDTVKERFITLDWRLAKRQRTWLKRHDFIQWYDLDDARRYLRDRLARQ